MWHRSLTLECAFPAGCDECFSRREVDAVLRFLKEQCTAKHIGVVGFCWGGVATHYLSLQYPELKAGVSVYGMPFRQLNMQHHFVELNFWIVFLQYCAGIIRDSEDRYELKSPTLFIFAEKDDVVPLDQVCSFSSVLHITSCFQFKLDVCLFFFPVQVAVLEAKLKEKCTVDYQVKIFPGQTHGFVHRKREDINPADKPFIQEGRTDMINWLNKYM